MNLNAFRTYIDFYDRYCAFNSLPNEKDSPLTKLRAFADDITNVAKIRISVFDLEENIVGKKRKC